MERGPLCPSIPLSSLQSLHVLFLFPNTSMKSTQHLPDDTTMLDLPLFYPIPVFMLLKTQTAASVSPSHQDTPVPATSTFSDPSSSSVPAAGHSKHQTLAANGVLE